LGTKKSSAPDPDQKIKRSGAEKGGTYYDNESIIILMPYPKTLVIGAGPIRKLRLLSGHETGWEAK